METTVAIAVGDWIRTHEPGIWQVLRILRVSHELRYSLSEPRRKSKRVIVFSRRIVNAKWCRSFSTACCEQSLCSPLSPDDRQRLDVLLKEDTELRRAFDLYIPEPIPLIVNVSLGIPDPRQLEAFCLGELAPAMATGVTMDQVLSLMEAAGLTQFQQKYPIRATLQMVCRDHELRDGEFVLRDCRVLPS